MKWLDDKADECGDRCKVMYLNSKSLEGRDLKLLKVLLLTPLVWGDYQLYRQVKAQYFLDLYLRPCSVDLLDGRFFSSLFSSVGRSKKKKKKKQKYNFIIFIIM